jgi:hypothetical protein
MNHLKASLRRLRGSLFHPGSYFADPEVTIWDGVIVVFVLFLVSFWQKLVWVDPGFAPINLWAALEKAAVNSLLIWCLFCVFFFAISGFFHRGINLARLSGMVGAAGLPVVLTTLLSALSWTVASILGRDTGTWLWLMLQNMLSYLGLALSWPGLFGFFLFQYGLKLSRMWAIALSVSALMLFVIRPLILILFG